MSQSETIIARPMSWGDLLRNATERDPSAGVVFPGERATYAEIDAKADAFGRLLLAGGVRPSDHVAVLLPPGIEMLAVMFAIAKIGCVVVPLSDRFKAAELRYVLGHSDSVAVVTTDATAAFVDFTALIRDALPGVVGAEQGALAPEHAPNLRRTILLSDTPQPGFGLASDLQAAADALPADAVDLVQERILVGDFLFMMYTSGTSAAPKGCLLTHESFARQAQGLAERRYFLSAGDTFWCPLPLFHNGGICTLTCCLTAGATYCHAGRNDPAVSLQQLEEERCTHAIPTFETIWMPILNHPDRANRDLSALRMGVNAGTPEYLRKIQGLLPTMTVLSNYGSTEASGSCVMALPDDDLRTRTETCGRALPGMELRIVDPETGAELGPDALGEIHLRGPLRFVEYYKDPERTAEAIDADGWFATGDRGSLTADGRLTFNGRLKDMLKVGGENVAAAEVEAYLLTHPAVNIVHVVGAPDARYTEVPAAYVELTPGATVTEEELIDFCVDQIATFKVPRYVRFVETWPMSGTKIQKFVLRERIEQELRDAGVTEAPRVRSRAAAS